jgi:FHS family L-fucose permease-like MFS transporter
MDKRKHKLFEAANGKNYLLPFILVTTLFFLWGFAHSILDVLNKHFQESMNISKAESALVQAVVYGGYFLMAIPAGRIIRRFGYRSGVLTGLSLYGIGALLFIPGGMLLSFPFFLFSLFNFWMIEQSAKLRIIIKCFNDSPGLIIQRIHPGLFYGKLK